MSPERNLSSVAVVGCVSSLLPAVRTEVFPQVGDHLDSRNGEAVAGRCDSDDCFCVKFSNFGDECIMSSGFRETCVEVNK